MIEPNARTCQRIVVDDARAIGFMGPELQVYGTPSMLRDAEMVCRDLLLPMLEPGQDSVGTKAEISHVGLAVLDAVVEVDAKILTVAARRIVFDVSVSTNGSVIGLVRHERMVVSVDRLIARVRELRAEVGSSS